MTSTAAIALAEGRTSGTTKFAVAIVPPEAGEYAVTVTVVDVQGNTSNVLEAGFVAMP